MNSLCSGVIRIFVDTKVASDILFLLIPFGTVSYKYKHAYIGKNYLNVNNFQSIIINVITITLDYTLFLTIFYS